MIATPFVDKWGGPYWALVIWTALSFTWGIIFRIYARPLIKDKRKEEVSIGRRLLLLLGSYGLYLMLTGYAILMHYGVLDLMSHRH